ncbi:MAG: DUF6525 family protein [Pseudomonadota bacterium]
MRDYDRLPPELRAWLASALLPWRPRSALHMFDRVRARTQDTAHAIQEMDRIQNRLVGRDACQVWGESHPEARDPHDR